MASWFSIVPACSLALALAGCAARASLPSYSVVPQFTLVDQNGAAFDSSAKLKGSVWIADFIYTTCPGPCPRMSSQMHGLESTLPAEIKLVSYTVDPQHDTPPVLKEYAAHFEAQPDRWYFLTGPIDRLEYLARNVFTLSDVGGDLEHSTRFVLIDRKSRVRGYYLSSEPDAMDRLAADAKRLVSERL